MIVDRSIVTRLNPEPNIHWQYLARNDALFAEAEWHWSDSMAEAFVFESHREASDFAKGIVYAPSDAGCNPPFARVLSGAEQQQRVSTSHSAARHAVRQVDPEETYRVTARRLGEHDDE